MSDEVVYVYGYGSKKHLPHPTEKDGRGQPMALCGASGGYPHPEPRRPTCKICLKGADKKPCPHCDGTGIERAAAQKEN